jgi:hypothetical protein
MASFYTWDERENFSLFERSRSEFWAKRANRRLEK